ncbi:hypothetical protein NEOLEDRAFT_1094113 [Neolentinus lepideus HHB14362 ss-1]|uniref:Ubiquitin-like-conjugating enzyme ATG10 n=1 Tax=Neolentinus lepideus HHB14362 ss-1 TaxID=1314782 RepID=A0A165RYU2_9AGAM|nr:hypothetical protein NEOLEDRAFT_1094113 [Neolentinus lepideus HHB14362 ss-1]
MSPPASLSRSQFEIACKASLLEHVRNDRDELAQRHLQGWTWVEHAFASGLGYLSRTVQLSHRQDTGCDDSGCVDEFDGQIVLEEYDDAVLSDPRASDTLIARQYVVHSATYQVPVFYFTIHNSKGAPLCLNDILRTSLFRPHTLPPSKITPFALSPEYSSFPLLSQGDHPTLGTPSWYIHPCETPKVIGEILTELPQRTGTEDPIQWMRVWFAVLGGVVDLRA